MQREADNEKIEQLLELKKQTMKCHIISQRINLQELMTEKQEMIVTEIIEVMEKKVTEREKEVKA